MNTETNREDQKPQSRLGWLKGVPKVVETSFYVVTLLLAPLALMEYQRDLEVREVQQALDVFDRFNPELATGHPSVFGSADNAMLVIPLENIGNYPISVTNRGFEIISCSEPQRTIKSTIGVVLDISAFGGRNTLIQTFGPTSDLNDGNYLWATRIRSETPFGTAYVEKFDIRFPSVSTEPSGVENQSLHNETKIEDAMKVGLSQETSFLTAFSIQDGIAIPRAGSSCSDRTFSPAADQFLDHWQRRL